MIGKRPIAPSEQSDVEPAHFLCATIFVLSMSVGHARPSSPQRFFAVIESGEWTPIGRF